MERCNLEIGNGGTNLLKSEYKANGSFYSVSKEISQSMEILIIDDSLTIVLLLEEFLKKLGYENVRYSQKGPEGVEIFREMVRLGKEPVVLLDYELGDCTGFEIITQILEINPTTKVIMATANAKSDDAIRKCFSNGAYGYLEKPIKFEAIKEILQTLILESGVKDEEAKTHDIIDNLISRSNQLSLEKIIEETHLKSKDLLEYLKKLESEGIIKSIGQISEISCERCDSINTKQNYSCPDCHNPNFQQGTLIEHYDCSNISMEQTYVDDICPKCKKEIKALGIDYKKMNNYYTCYECQSQFQQPAIDYLCLKCNNKFNFDEAKMKFSPGFLVITPFQENEK